MISITRETAWLMGIDPVATGNLLRDMRCKANLSQEGLSWLFEKAGDSASRVTISNWETGKKLPTLSHLVFLAELYECSLDELVMSFRRSCEHQGHDQPDHINIRRMYKKVCSSFLCAGHGAQLGGERPLWGRSSQPPTTSQSQGCPS